MDPLSDVLSLLRPHHYRAGAIDLGRPWSIRFPDQQGAIKCNALLSGECWVSVEGDATPTLMRAGDFFLLPSGRPFTLASDPGRRPVPVERAVDLGARTPINEINGGGDALLVSSHFKLAEDAAPLLTAVLPPVVHVRSDAEDAMHLRRFVELILRELREPRPGGSLIAGHLSQLMLVQTLRLHQAEGGEGLGWLSAMADRRLGAAVAAMHDDPAHRWTVQSLAGRAGMSRSVFARRFREVVGETPMEYLTRWRMLRAGDRLARAGDPVSVVAASLGYDSDSAFSTAFKRTMGASPRDYVRRRGAEADPAARSIAASGH